MIKGCALTVVMLTVMIVAATYMITDLAYSFNQKAIMQERTVQIGIEQQGLTDRQLLKSQESTTNTCIQEGWNAWKCMDRGGVNGVHRGWLFHEWLILIGMVGVLAVFGLHLYKGVTYG